MFRFLGNDSKAKTADSSEATGSSWRDVFGGVFRRGRVDDELWDELEEALIVSDVGIQVSMRLVETLRERVSREGVSDPDVVRLMMRDEIVRMLDSAGSSDGFTVDGPLVVMLVGVNGSGKTTTVGKLIHAAVLDGRSTLVAAADTFRAGAIDQVRTWAERGGSECISSSPGSDPGSVVFDSMQAARARGTDFLVIDTAGRLHTSSNLMEELRKVRRILDRESSGYSTRVLLVIDGTTGQNGLSQARLFTDAVSCDGVVLTKLDSTAKGGVSLAISGELGLPIWFVGTGEGLGDFAEFDSRAFAYSLFPSE